MQRRDDGIVTTPPQSIEERAAHLVTAAQSVREAAGQPRCSAASAPLLASLEEAFQLLSAGWYQLAADAAPNVARRRSGQAQAARDDAPPHESALSPEQEVELVATLHDVAAALARCARVCREARPVVAPLIARRFDAGSDDSDPGGHLDPASSVLRLQENLAHAQSGP
jgi:hypothetical protein